MGTKKGNRPSDLSRGDRPRLSVVERHNLTGADFTSVLLATCNASPTFAGEVFGRTVGLRGRPREVSCYRDVQLNGQPNSRVPDGLVELTDRWGRRRRILVNVERNTFGNAHEDELRQELDIVRKVKLDRLVGISAARPADDLKRSLASRWSPLATRQLRFLSWMEVWLCAERLLEDEIFVRTSEAQIVYEFYDFFRRRAYKLLPYQPFGPSLSATLNEGFDDENRKGSNKNDDAILSEWQEFIRFSSLRLRLPMATAWPDVTLFDTQSGAAQLASNRQLCARVSIPNWHEAIYLALDLDDGSLTMQARARVPLYAHDVEKSKAWLQERLSPQDQTNGVKTGVRFDFASDHDPISMPISALYFPKSSFAEEDIEDEADAVVESTPELKTVIVERTVPLCDGGHGGRDVAEYAERELRSFHAYLRRVMK